MADVFLAFGSNLGDRRANIEQAISLLKPHLGSPVRLSSFVPTPACGFDGPEFINAVALYRSGISPFELLKICKTVERCMGRTDEPEYDCLGNRIYHDRVIDIDILKCGDIVLDTPDLTLPHPQIKNRPYILPLLLEIY